MNKTAIVFVHGHMGSSKQFVALQSLLAAGDGLCCHNIVLPGHEGELADFLATDRHDWQDAVNARLAELGREYERLVLVGHSLGGLLLINAAVAAPDKVAAIFALSCPLRLRMTRRGLRWRLLSLHPARPGESPDVTAARDMRGVAGITAGDVFRLLPSALELLRTIRETRRTLPRLTVPLTVICSHNDEIVSPRSLALAKKLLPAADTLLLREAGHFRFPAAELEIIARLITQERKLLPPDGVVG